MIGVVLTMGRRPKSDADAFVLVGDVAVKVATSTLQTLNAKAFIAALLARGVSPSVAGLYARTAARSIRAGRAYQPDLILNVAERTSVRAYWRWATEAYAQRMSPVRRKLLLDGKQVARLRCSSLVPPLPDKHVPRVARAAEVHLNHEQRTSQYVPPRFEWVPCHTWTLHVPTGDDVPVHKDPCTECMMFDLTAEQVEVIAAAFEDAWGHRDLAKMPPEALLFGPQPPEAAVAPRKFSTAGHIVALTLPSTAVADALTPLRATMTADRTALLERIAEKRVHHLVLSREADPKLFAHVLSAIGATDSFVEEPVVDERPPLPKPEPLLPAPTWMQEQPSYAPPPALTLVPPVESGPVPVALQDPPSAPVSDWTGEWQKPDNGPPVPPEVAAQLSAGWWEKSQAEFAAQFPHLLPKP